MTRSYLDHASSSPLRPEARAAWHEAIDRLRGDPGRIHEEGMVARVALETAREQVAALVGARSREVVFTSGATESIVTAARGAVARSIDRAGPDAAHQVVTAVEHSAVGRTVEQLGPVTTVGVDHRGRVDADAVVDAITDRTAVVHVQWANHEVGTVQPVEEIVAACRERKVLVHVDAAQAVGRLPVDFRGLGADLLSLSGHKFGGPPGTGALLVRRGLRIPPLHVGGDQERARRAGLEAVPTLVALGAAAAVLTDPERLEAEITAARARLERLEAVAESIAGVTVFGDRAHRLPHLLCLGIAGVEPQGVLLGLDRAGIAGHSGSSCSSEALEPSPVLEAMGVEADRSLRLSVGWDTTDEDIDRVAGVLPELIADLRGLAAHS